MKSSIYLATIILIFGFAHSAVAQSDDDQNPYASDARQIAQVRQEHLAELMKVPHVRGVATELNERGEVVIAVVVDKPEHLDEVSSAIPSTLDGFPVDVEVAQTNNPPLHKPLD